MPVRQHLAQGIPRSHQVDLASQGPSLLHLTRPKSRGAGSWGYCLSQNSKRDAGWEELAVPGCSLPQADVFQLKGDLLCSPWEDVSPGKPPEPQGLLLRAGRQTMAQTEDSPCLGVEEAELATASQGPGLELGGAVPAPL